MSEQSKTLEIMRRIGAPRLEKIRISGIIQSPMLSSLTFLLPGGDSDSTAAVLEILAEHDINIRFINKYRDSVGNTSLCLCIDADVLDRAIGALDVHEESLGIRDFVYHPEVIVISIYPHKQRPRVAERLLTALRMDGIDPLSTNNASSVVSCVVKSESVEQALACLAGVFELP